jgi:glycosyltransferase involved in cell wall biosynthesis
MPGSRADRGTVGGPPHEDVPEAPPAPPIISVVIITYEGRERIDGALRSLFDQDFDQPYEVIVVASGEDGCADHVRSSYPFARVIHSRQRLLPGPARNRGLREARGRYVAFLADDCVPAPGWVRRRVDKHLEGFDAVGGAITNGTGWHPVGLAGYLLEYWRLMPSNGALATQHIPHTLSYDRRLFELHGEFPEDVNAGEDTVFNLRCVDAGVPIGFDTGIRIAHRNITGLRSYLRHQWNHGRGLAYCIDRHGLGRTDGRPAASSAPLHELVRYPWRRLTTPVNHLRKGPRRWLLAYLLVSPLTAAGAWAAALGRYTQTRAPDRAPDS